jgi:membrane protease YdiL (CAAX protease family)
MIENSARVVSQESSGRTVLYLAVVFYLFAFVNEYLAIYYPFYSAIASIVSIFLALNIAAFNAKNALYRILPALVLVPFMRLLSLVLPLTIAVAQVWYLLVSVPVLIAIFFILHTRKIPLAEIGLRRSPWKTQLPIAVTGLPLGFIGYLILHPQPLFSSDGPLMWVVNLLTVLFCVALTEEVLFRGILLRLLSEVNVKFPGLWLAILYASLHLGSRSPAYIVYMGIVGWLFARFAIHTHSILGVIIANFFIVAGMGLIWPMLLR